MRWELGGREGMERLGAGRSFAFDPRGSPPAVEPYRHSLSIGHLYVIHAVDSVIPHLA